MRIGILFVVLCALAAALVPSVAAAAGDVCLEVWAQGYGTQWNTANTGCDAESHCAWRTLLRINTFNGELQYIEALVGPNEPSLRAVQGFRQSNYELECNPHDIFMRVAGLEWQLDQDCQTTMGDFAAATSSTLRASTFGGDPRVVRAIGIVRQGFDGPFFANSTIQDSIVPC